MMFSTGFSTSKLLIYTGLAFISSLSQVYAVSEDEIINRENVSIGEEAESFAFPTSTAFNGKLSTESPDLHSNYIEVLNNNYSGLNITESVNETVNVNGTNASNSTLQVSCIQNKTLVGLPVEIVNSTRLASLLQIELNITSRQTPGNCVAVLFYSPSCPFSCMAAPHYNALPRFFPDIKMVAVDAMSHRTFNTQYGIFSIPTLLLFHNGRPAARLNETSDYSLDMFAKFIESCTNVKSSGKLVVTSADFAGPISSVPLVEKDYYLILSWIVIALQLLYTFYCSSWGRWLVDATLNAWREAEAQHHHAD